MGRDREADRLRSRAYWEQRRAREQCQSTGCSNVPDVNPRTGERFWKCRPCRLALSEVKHQ